MKQLEYVQETIVEQLEEVANCEGNFLYRAYIIMSFAPYPEDPTYPLDYEQSYLISIKQATDLATKIIRAAFQNENIARIDSFSDKKSDLMRLLHAFNKTIQLYENPEEFNYINYAINFVISYFKENIESGKIRRGENISDLVKSFSFEIDDDYYDQECIDDEKASNRDKIDTYFGSLDNLKLIINDFYEASDKDKQSAINKIQSCI
jgi:hypothetical protein